MKKIFPLLLVLAACNQGVDTPVTKGGRANDTIKHRAVNLSGPSIVVLGIAQDAGYPQAGCKKDCCKRAWGNPQHKRMASCIAVVDPISGDRWIFDATPDFREQLQLLDSIHPPKAGYGISGVFLTHGHVGHYTGLMHLGREAMGAKEVPVYTMPRMNAYLQQSGPWSQLVELKNIELRMMKPDSAIRLNERISVTPFLVPHRDEFTETVGFKITGPEKSAVFIPDIDKWSKWERSIVEFVKETNYAFLDATFYANGEIPGRDMSDIPHPFIEESMELFNDHPNSIKAKLHFIHLNHTNPVLDTNSEEYRKVVDAGYKVAFEKQVISL